VASAADRKALGGPQTAGSTRCPGPQLRGRLHGRSPRDRSRPSNQDSRRGQRQPSKKIRVRRGFPQRRKVSQRKTKRRIRVRSGLFFLLFSLFVFLCGFASLGRSSSVTSANVNAYPGSPVARPRCRLRLTSTTLRPRCWRPARCRWQRVAWPRIAVQSHNTFPRSSLPPPCATSKDTRYVRWALLDAGPAPVLAPECLEQLPLRVNSTTCCYS